MELLKSSIHNSSFFLDLFTSFAILPRNLNNNADHKRKIKYLVHAGTDRLYLPSIFKWDVRKAIIF